MLNQALKLAVPFAVFSLGCAGAATLMADGDYALCGARGSFSTRPIVS